MIEINHINMDFKSELTRKKQRVLNDISFTINEGDCLAVLGESGSGKSTLGRVLVGLLKPTSGAYFFEGVNPYSSRHNRHFLTEHISVVFQDYTTSVNPRFTVAEIIMESLRMLVKKGRVVDYNKEVVELLELVGLDETYKNRFPHQLSGGQVQRVCIARAIALKPRVILFDEAISSLDAHTQVQIMDLLAELRQKLNLTYVFITHDLMSVTYLCNRVMFLYKGEVTEMIDVADLGKTEDEYAKKLLSAVIHI